MRLGAAARPVRLWIGLKMDDFTDPSVRKGVIISLVLDYDALCFVFPHLNK